MFNLERRIGVFRETLQRTKDYLLHPISYAKELREQQGLGRIVMWNTAGVSISIALVTAVLQNSHPELISVTFPALIVTELAYFSLMGVYGVKTNPR